MVTVTIDGKKIEVAEGTTVLRAAESAGITIPTLCDHKSLTPYGGCRLCLVEVEGMRTLQPSCTLPVSPNMVIKTDSAKVKEARKFVLTLIFSERNHFCMYCQVSGGDCSLQNAAYSEGMTHWPLQPNWQPFAVDASNPFFVLDNNRCILCRKCVRACAELVGNFTLGIEERGANSYLVADLGTPLGDSTCISCGTCVQVCPTGALIDRQSAYLGREKDTTRSHTICTQCSIGCGMDVIHRDNHISRIEGNWDAEINKGVLCVMGRFEPVENKRDRLVTPMVRKDNTLKAARYEDALAAASAGLKNGSIAAMISSTLPAHALSAFKKVFGEGGKAASYGTLDEGEYTRYAMALKSAFKKPFETSLQAIDDADIVISIGADFVKDHQVAGFMVKRGQPFGKKLVVLADKGSLAKEYADTFIDAGANYAAGMDKVLDAAKKFTGTKVVILIGKDVTGPDEAFGSGIAGLVDGLKKAGKEVGVLSFKGNANAYTAYLLDINSSINFKDAKSAFVFLGEEEPSQKLIKDLEKISFLVVQATYSSALTARADVVIPAPIWSETEGSFVNMEGKIQTSSKILQAPEGVVDVVRVLCDLAKTSGVKVDGDWQKNIDKSRLVNELVGA